MSNFENPKTNDRARDWRSALRSDAIHRRSRRRRGGWSDSGIAESPVFCAGNVKDAADCVDVGQADVVQAVCFFCDVD